MSLNDAQQRILEAIDEQAIVDVLRDIVNVASPTGEEEAVATLIHERLSSLGVRSQLQRFAPGRANVIARIEGTGDGPTLMLNGHLDTSYTGHEPELQGIGYKNQAILDGDWMYGNGVHNMKNALASYIAVAGAIVRSGERLRGDVVIAGVAGEIERAPYGKHQGSTYEGFGTGTGYALGHGLTADMCILGEPTANTIGLSNMGVSWIRISTKGTMAHTQHADTAANAITRMRRVLDHLDGWTESYRDRHRYEGIRPAADVTAIEGGWPWRVSRTPVFCDAFLCVRMPPGLTTGDVLRDLRAALDVLRQADPPIETEVEAYVSHTGAAISRDEPIVRALDAAHRAVMGAEPVYRPRGAYMDSSHLVALGIPTVVYGASGRLREASASGETGWSPAQGEHTYLPDLIAGTRAVAATVADVCGRSIDEVRPAGRPQVG